MAFKTNDYQQITLSDSYINLSPKTRKIVEKSWAKDFADIVFPAINDNDELFEYTETYYVGTRYTYHFSNI